MTTASYTSPTIHVLLLAALYHESCRRPVAEGTTLAHAENQAKPFTEFGDLPSEVKRGRILTASELLQKIEITGITDDSTGALDAVQVEWLAELIHTSEKAAVEAGLVAVKLDPPRPWIEFADLPELAQQGRERQASFLLQRRQIELLERLLREAREQ